MYLADRMAVLVEAREREKDSPPRPPHDEGEKEEDVDDETVENPDESTEDSAAVVPFLVA